MRHTVLLFVAITGCSPSAPRVAPAARDTPDHSQVRRELEAWYDANHRAFLAKDLPAIMSLRSAAFHTITPDGQITDRTAMQQRTQGLLNGIEQWISLSDDIDSLEVVDGEARAIVRQHLVRRALRGDGQVHHVETWVTQRETFRREDGVWRLYRVDNLRDQRRLVDGQPS